MDRAQAIERHRGALMSFARLTGAGGDTSSVIEHDGVVASLCPAVPHASIVNSVGYRDAETLAASVDELAAAYEGAGVRAWTIWVPEDDREVAALLESAGHRLDATPTAMVMDLAALPEPDADDLDWDPNADPAVVAEINDNAYGAPAGTFAPAIARFGDIDGMRLYQARIDGEPVCVLATYDNGDDSELYLVATRTEHRGKGLARRLTHRALLEARDRGMAISNLQATKLGYPVYARLGYEPICTRSSALVWARPKLRGGEGREREDCRAWTARRASPDAWTRKGLLVTPLASPPISCCAMPVDQARLDAAIEALSKRERFREAESVVTAAAPKLQRILAEALEEGGWFGEAHEAEVRKAAEGPTDDERMTTIRTLLAEEARMGMMVGVAVGWALAEELSSTEQEEE